MARRKKFDHSWVPKPGTVLDGRYRLEEMVDRGGMGVIMRGEHVGMKRDVAVKLLSPDIATESGYRDRFRREVDLASTIEHPNIVRCYDFGETEDGVLYLVMELLEGQSLKEVLTAETRMSTRRVANIMLQALDGMATAHLKDVVHRDLKPSNIYIVHDHRGDEVVKVLDFGLAKSLSSGHVSLTRTGAVCGTASYVPPESLVLQQTGTEGDIYAVGLIMLEMLIGRQVCMARAMAQTFLQHLVVPARIPLRIWETEFGQLIAKALHKHPEDRFKNAEEMYQALKGMIAAIEDITLEPSELPPLPSDDLDNGLLNQLGEGKYAIIDALRELPVPEPWSVGGDRDDLDDVQTQRGLVLDLDRMAGLMAAAESGPPTIDNSEPPRNRDATAEYPETERWVHPPADKDSSELETERHAIQDDVADTLHDEPSLTLPEGPVEEVLEVAKEPRPEEPEPAKSPEPSPAARQQSAAPIVVALAIASLILLILLLT